MSKVYFVGGYYNPGKFLDSDGGVEYEFWAYSEVAIYDIESVMELGFVDGVSEDYETRLRENEDAEWNKLSEVEKAKFIFDYAETDEIAGLSLCDNLEEANRILKSCLADIKTVEEEYEVVGKEQDSEGYYNEVYKKRM